MRMRVVDPFDETKVIGSIDDTEEETEWVQSPPLMDDFLKHLPQMIRDL